MFHTVTDPHEWPGPGSASAVGGAWLHGALCGAAAHQQAHGALPDRPATAADLLEAVGSYETQCQETGDSRRALARYGLRRDRDQPVLAARAPDQAVELVGSETGMTARNAAELLGLIVLDGMAVALNALDRLAHDPSPANEKAERELARIRNGQEALDQALDNLAAGIAGEPDDDPGTEHSDDREMGPIDQPIEMLPVIAGLIDEELAGPRELYATLSKARAKPHVLDDHTVHRVIQVYREKREFHADYEWQLSRWRELQLTGEQRREVQRLEGELEPLATMIEKILKLAAELERGMINQIMRKSDLELGLETLLGLIPPP